MARVSDDGHMVSLRRWVAVLSATVLTSILLPAAAWANESPAAAAVIEAARGRRRVGSTIGLFGAVCCLAVVAVIVLVVLLIARGRRSRR